MSMFTQLARSCWVKIAESKITLLSVNKRCNAVKLAVELQKGSTMVIDGAVVCVNDINNDRGDRVRLAIDADKSIKIEHERKRERA